LRSSRTPTITVNNNRRHTRHDSQKQWPRGCRPEPIVGPFANRCAGLDRAIVRPQRSRLHRGFPT
jgi:hypothetical protein